MQLLLPRGSWFTQRLEAALVLEKDGINVEVIDPRTLAPMDKDTILRSVAKTTRLLVVSEDVMTCGVASEISAMVAEYGMFSLDLPIKRIAVPDTPIPFAPVMERAVIPQVERITEAVKSLLN